MRLILAILFIAFITNAYAAETSYCTKSPPIKGACFTVHGRLRIGSGTPSMRIWPIGTKRLLGVYEWGMDYRDTAPPIIFELMKDDLTGTDLYGDYTVCPLDKERKGWMRMVCMKSATHLRAVPR